MADHTLDDNTRRGLIAGAVLRTVARENLGSELLMRDATGAAPIVVALGHERLSEVVSRVRATGGAANVFIETERGIIRCSISDAHGLPQLVDDSHTEPFGDEPIHSDSTMEMFLAWTNTQDGAIQFSIQLPSSSASVAGLRPVELDRVRS